MKPAVLLCFHGSRHAAAAHEAAHIAARLAHNLQGSRVEHGFLQYAEPSLAKQLSLLAEGGTRDIVVLPVMLFTAGHVTADIPAVLAAFGRANPTVRVRQARPLAGDPALLDAARDRLQAAATTAERGASMLLVVGRGTADETANASVAAAAARLRERMGFAAATAAFAGVADPPVEPALDEAARIHARIVVLPWFLTTGVLVNRLSAQVDAAAARHPSTALSTAAHLGDHPRVIDALAARATETERAAARRAS